MMLLLIVLSCSISTLHGEEMLVVGELVMLECTCINFDTMDLQNFAVYTSSCFTHTYVWELLAIFPMIWMLIFLATVPCVVRDHM